MAFLDSTGLQRVLTKLSEKFVAEANARKTADDTLSGSISSIEDNLMWYDTTGTVEGYSNVASL